MKKDILKSEIFKDKIGKFILGMSFSKFKIDFLETLALNPNREFIDVNNIDSTTRIYSFFDSIDCFFDLKKSILIRIDVYNNFSGRYLYDIGIGEKLKCLKNKGIKLTYDDDNVMLSNNSDWSISAVVDKDLTVLNNINEIYDSKIERITLLHPNW